MSKKNTTDELESVSTGPRKTRGIGGRYKASFRNPFNTDIPDNVKQAFERAGYSLRWVRVVDPKTKTVDHQRIHNFLSVGGEIVTVSEMKRVDSEFLVGLTKHSFREEFADEEDQKTRGDATGMRKGDLILMKLPLEYIEDKRRYNVEAVEQTLAQKQQSYKDRTGGTYKIEVTNEDMKMDSAFFDK